MNRYRHLIVSAAALCIVDGVSAQTAPLPLGSVLFGVLDVGVRAVRNGDTGTFKSESTDGLTSSRLGVRGNEDLGDNIRAGFWLEAGLAPDTGGTNAKFFNRRSTVSLVHPTFGEIRLGRDYTPLFTAYAAYDPFGTNGLASIVGSGTAGGTSIISALGSGSQTLTRADNQVSYFLPPGLGGVYGQLAATPSEGVVGNKYWGARLGYQKGPLDVSAGYEQTTVANDSKFKQVQAGAAYDLKVVKIGGQVLRSTWDGAPVSGRRQMVYQIGLSAPFGQHQVRADVIRGDMRGGAAGSGYGNSDDATQFALGWQYNFSKRTALYATAAQIRNRGASTLVLSVGRPGMKPGDKSNGAEFGLRHSF